MTVRALGVEAERGRAPTAIGVIRPRTLARSLGRDERAAHETAPCAGAGGLVEAERPRLAAGEHRERLGDDGVDGLAALPPRGDEPDLAQLAQVPRDERLGQPDVLDQLGDRGGAVGEHGGTMRSRLTSASTLWKRRSSRRSSGWSTADAIVLRMRAGEGDTGGGDLRCG